MIDRRQLMRGAAALAAGSLAKPSRANVETGVTDSVIRVGQSAVLSGKSSGLGLEMQQGIQAYFKTVNRSGGVFDRTFELVSLDDGYEPRQAVENTKKLIGEARVFALLGYTGTPTSKAALPVFTDARVPFFGAFTGADVLRTPFNRLVFNCRASYVDEGPPIIKQLTTYSEDPKVALFVQNDAYGDAVQASIERALHARGLAPVVVAKVQRNSENVSDAVEAISKSGATAVAMGSVYGACAALMRGLRGRGVYPVYASVSFVGTSSLLANVGDDAKGIGISQVMPYPLSGTIPLTREYGQAMAAEGYPLSYGSIEGFVAAKMFVAGVRHAGATLTRERFITALESMGNHDLGGFNIEFTPTNHNGSRFTEMTVVGDNRRLLR